MGPRRQSTSSHTAAANATPQQEQIAPLTVFIANLDPRALLYMYAQMEDRTLESLRGASLEQLRVVMAMRNEINIEHWQAKVQEFLSGPVNSIDWNGFPGIVGNGGTQGINPTGAAGQDQGVRVDARDASFETPTRGGAAVPQDVATRMMEVLVRIEEKLSQPPQPVAHQYEVNDLGRKRNKARELLDEVHGVHGDEFEEYEEEKPRKKGKVDIMEAVRKYYDGTAPLTDRQHLIQLELSKLPLTSISAFFGALRRVASTIEAGEGEYRKFNETMTHTEAMVLDLFGEAVGNHGWLTAKHRDGLEAKFVTLIKAKMLSSKEFNFVKAAADAQQVIMKELKEPQLPKERPGPWKPSSNPTCYECGRKGHKSFECKADEEAKKKHRESRAAKQA